MREIKESWLFENDVKTTEWQLLQPSSPYYFLVPRTEAHREMYEKHWKVTNIFLASSIGVQTSRDEFVIDFDREALKRRIEMFRNLSMPDDLVKQTFKLKDTRGWKLVEARKELARDPHWDKYFTKILYRPFDSRDVYYTQKMVDWPRSEVMRHMMQENLGICIGRAGQVVGLEKPWNIVFCSQFIEDLNLFYRGGNVNFPLYLYPDSDKKDMFSHLESGERKPNLSPKLVKVLAIAYGEEPTPEAVFYYIYGVLYANTYRRKYAEFLKIDFPRVPFTKDYDLFLKIGEYGKKLVDLHLVKSAELDSPIAKLRGSGDCKMDKPNYNREEKRIYINKSQYFEGVDEEVWKYQIGGYKVAEKWLKDRKGRTLSPDDIRHYCRVITALKKTMEIQQYIDALYPEIETETVPIDI